MATAGTGLRFRRARAGDYFLLFNRVAWLQGIRPRHGTLSRLVDDGVVYLGIIAIGLTSLMHQPQDGEPGDGWYGLFIVLPVYVVALIVLIPIVRNQVQGSFKAWRWRFWASSTSAGCSAISRSSPMPTNAYGYLLYVIFADGTQRRGGVHVWKAFRQTSVSQQHQPEENLGRRSRRARSFDGAARGLLRFSFPHFGATAIDAWRA